MRHSITMCVLLLSSMLFIGAAAAQTPYGPTVNGRQLQPTQQQLESKWNRWNDRDQPEVDRLYNVIMRAESRSIDQVQR
jgi:hypothetical protein